MGVGRCANVWDEPTPILWAYGLLLSTKKILRLDNFEIRLYDEGTTRWEITIHPLPAAIPPQIYTRYPLGTVLGALFFVGEGTGALF